MQERHENALLYLKSNPAVLLTVHDVDQWELPPFQRPLRINQKVRELAARLQASGGIIEGKITLGWIRSDPHKRLWLIDGNHRMAAFRISHIPEVYSEVEVSAFESMDEMALKFKILNARIARMTPDDNLRAIEYSNPRMHSIRDRCPVVGYGSVKRNASQHMVGMSVLLRSWEMSRPEVPLNSVRPVEDLAATLTDTDVNYVTAYLAICHEAWHHDRENYRLWGQLNMTICMWLYRRLVIDKDRSGGRRRVILDNGQFRRCLMRLSADSNYVDWLGGRLMNERERAPAFYRIRENFVRCLRQDEGMAKPALPSPTWAPK